MEAHQVDELSIYELLLKHTDDLGLADLTSKNLDVRILQQEPFVCQVLISGKSFVVKKDVRNPILIQRGLEREYVATRLIENAGFTTRKLLFYEIPFAVYSFVPGEPLSLDLSSQWKERQILDRVVAVISDLHTRLATNIYGGPGEHINYTSTSYGEVLFEYIENDLAWNAIPITAYQRQVLDKAKSSVKFSKYTLCHGGLNPHNIIYDNGSVTLIDWKHSLYADPALDISNLLFWLLLCQPEEASIFIEQVAMHYQTKGFSLLHQFGIYLGRRYITMSYRNKLRQVNQKLLDIGFELLDSCSINSVRTILQNNEIWPI